MFTSKRITIMGGDKFRDEFSLEFDGTNDYIETPTVFTNATTYTLGCWIKYLAEDTYDWLFGTNSSTKSFGLNRAGDQIFYRGDGAGKFYGFGDNSNIPLNKWTHLVFTSNATTISCYINGNLLSTITVGSTTDLDGSVALANTKFTFSRINGAYESGGTVSYLVNCKLSDVFAYDSYMTASQVKTLYNGREPYNHKEGIVTANLTHWYRMGDGVHDIKKGSLISDEVDSTLGSDLVTEGDFSNGGAAWTASGNITTAVNGGAFVSTGDSDGGFGSCAQSETLTSGNVYLLTFDVTAVTGSPSVHNYCGQMQTSLGVAKVKTYTNVFLSDGTDGIDIRTICSNGQGMTINNIKFQLVNGNAGVMTNMDSVDFVGDTP